MRRSVEPIYDSSESEGEFGEAVTPAVDIEFDDDGVQHEPLPNGTVTQQQSSWFGRAGKWITNTVTAVADTLFVGSPTGGDGSNNDPFDDTRPIQLYISDRVVHSPQSHPLRLPARVVDGQYEMENPMSQLAGVNNRGGGGLERSGMYNEEPYGSPRMGFDAQMAGSQMQMLSSGSDDFEGEMTLQIDLVTAIRHYLRSPGDALFSLVSTALTTRSYANPVTGDELLAANGDPALVSLIIQSGCLDLSDPQIGEELRRLVNSRTEPSDQHSGRVNPSNFLFLRDLLSVRCVRISEKQRDLLRVSGFEFVQLLHNNKHVMSDIPAPLCLSIEFWSRVSRKMDVVLMLLGICIIYADVVAVAWSMTNFFQKDDDWRGWVTLLVWVGGEYLNLFGIRLLTATKADESVYGEAMADFPTPYLKIIPCLPLFETYTFLSAMKHKCIAKANYVVQHDLVAMFTLSCITHSLFTATPQIMLQTYFHSWIGDEDEESSLGFQILGLSTLISLCSALPMYLRFVVTFDSVNSVGFAFFGDQMPVDNKPPVSKFARVIAFVLLYFLEFNVFLLIIALLHVSSCGDTMIFLISVVAFSIVFTVIMFVWTCVTTRSMLRASKWLFIPVVVQVGFNVYFSVSGGSETDPEDCKLFLIIGGMSVVYGYVGWGMLLSIFACWGIHKLYISYVKDRATTTAEIGNGELMG